MGQRVGSPVPFQLGVVEAIRSAVLNEERTLNIALPQGYHPDSAARYPVIYLLDGGADEDFIHVTGALQFAAFAWVAWQPPSIVVGIASTDRKRDLTFPTTIAADKEQFPTTGGSGAFMRFIGEEVIPFVEANYRTGGERMLIGQSLGGLFAAEVLIKRPELFTRYLIVSPSLWWDDGSLLKVPAAFLSDPAKAPTEVYIAVGKEGRRMGGDAERLHALVKKSPKIRSGASHLPKHDHANSLHQAVIDGFRWMGGK
ncbi:MAG: alpha/beta hydrolase-fold protein [Flavobacteriales bacterium]